MPVEEQLRPVPGPGEDRNRPRRNRTSTLRAWLRPATVSGEDRNVYGPVGPDANPPHVPWLGRVGWWSWVSCRFARHVGAACPVFPGKRYEDWKLDDPAGKGVAAGGRRRGVALSVALSLLLWPHWRRAGSAYGAPPPTIGPRSGGWGTPSTGCRPSAPSIGCRLRRWAHRPGPSWRSAVTCPNGQPDHPLDPPSAVALSAGANYVVRAANLMENAVSEVGYRADGCQDAAEPVRSAQQALLGGLAGLADRLAGARASSSWLPQPNLHVPRTACIGGAGTRRWPAPRWRWWSRPSGSAASTRWAAIWPNQSTAVAVASRPCGAGRSGGSSFSQFPSLRSFPDTGTGLGSAHIEGTRRPASREEHHGPHSAYRC